jgi:hypothetical protein
VFPASNNYTKFTYYVSLRRHPQRQSKYRKKNAVNFTAAYFLIGWKIAEENSINSNLNYKYLRQALTMLYLIIAASSLQLRSIFNEKNVSLKEIMWRQRHIQLTVSAKRTPQSCYPSLKLF